MPDLKEFTRNQKKPAFSAFSSCALLGMGKKTARTHCSPLKIWQRRVCSNLIPEPLNFMSEKPTEERVKEIIVEQLGVTAEQITPEASFLEDLGADSLDTVELVMAFEEEFNIEVPDDDAEKLQTVGDVIRYIEEKTS